MKCCTWLISFAIFALLWPTVATAQSIGVHFPSDRDTTAGLAPGEMAGIPGSAQANWNYADGGLDDQANASGSTADIVSPNPGVLTLADGTQSGATVEWTSNGTWNTANGTATGDAKLMNGYIDAIGADDPVSRVSFSGLPDVGEYSAIVYFGSDGNGRTGELTDGTTTYSFSTFSNDPDGSGGFDASDYVQTTDTAMGFPESNYAIFGNLTGSTWSVEVLRGSNNAGIHGVQLIGIPEPAAMSLLLGAAAFGFGFVRRRR